MRLKEILAERKRKAEQQTTAQVTEQDQSNELWKVCPPMFMPVNDEDDKLYGGFF